MLFQQDSTDTTSYDSLSNITLELPEPWMVDYEGDVTTVELVGCITRRVSQEFVETCDYGDEGGDTVYLLDAYNASTKSRCMPQPRAKN